MMSIKLSSILPEDLAEYIEEAPIDEIPEPQEVMTPGDHVVGILNEGLIRLFGLACVLMEKAAGQEQMADYLLADGYADQSNAAHAKMDKYLIKYEVIAELLLLKIRSDFNLWDKPNIGIRTGFRVVWFNDDTDSIVHPSPESIH